MTNEIAPTEPPASAPFDFSTMDTTVVCDTPIEIEIVRPDTRQGLGVFVSLVGQESESFLRYTREEANAARQRAFEQARLGKPDLPSKIEEDEDTIVKALAACLRGWRTVIDGKSEPVILEDGKKLQFSNDNALFWLRKYRWVRPQISLASAELGNFIAR